METEVHEPPKALNVRPKAGHRLWCVLVIRANATDIETLPDMHLDKADAVKQAHACRGRWLGVSLAVAPVAVDAAHLEMVEEATGEVRISDDGITGSSNG